MKTSELSREDVRAIFHRPLLALVADASQVHDQHHDRSRVQCAALLSVKTGACPEDCAYCPQSSRYRTGLEREKLMDRDRVRTAAERARAQGADRFCMGAAWREVRDDEDFDRVLEMVRDVKEMGLETCVTLGMLQPKHAEKLRAAGLDYYNHNLDSSREFYGDVISTRTYDDRLETLSSVRAAGIKVCCGGILGMGETEEDRIGLLWELARQVPYPESVPINALVAVEGTPLEQRTPVAWHEMARMVACARILMPTSKVRLSAGRTEMSEEAQALCFLAGANSIFLGETLLTTPNPGPSQDAAMLHKLGLQMQSQPA